MNYATYLETNRFLADINNEIPDEGDDLDGTKSRNATYKANFASLDNLVMALFDQDQTVIPKESSWFGSYSIPDDNDAVEESSIISMKKQMLYKEDWVGLRKLDDAGKVFLVVCEGAHMQLSDECWRPIVKRWVGNVDMDANVKDSNRKVEIPPLLVQDW
jgi:palmitoyl-protein thioesterase